MNIMWIYVNYCTYVHRDLSVQINFLIYARYEVYRLIKKLISTKPWKFDLLHLLFKIDINVMSIKYQTFPFIIA